MFCKSFFSIFDLLSQFFQAYHVDEPLEALFVYYNVRKFYL